MKKKSILVIFLLGTLIASAFKIVDDIIDRLGMMQSSAQGNIVANVVGSFSSDPMAPYDGNAGDESTIFRLPYVPNLSTIISGDKAVAAKEVCEYVKKFINSEEFITQYNMARESAMPLTDKGSGLASLIKDKTVIEKNIRNYKTDIKYVAEQQKLLDETQKRIDGLVQAAKKPFPGKANWEKRYPTDPSALVKKRLQEYLALVTTVDFNAKLTEPDEYKIKKFVNPAYEKKSRKWKAIYRAGKEVNDVITAFVKEWLKGEIISPLKIKMTDLSETKAIENKNSQPQATTEQAEPSEPAATPAPVKKETAAPGKKLLLKKIREKANKVINK